MEKNEKLCFWCYKKCNFWEISNSDELYLSLEKLCGLYEDFIIFIGFYWIKVFDDFKNIESILG